MSGKPKPKPTEAESLRQVIREAHEAIKDTRAVIRELRAERAEHAAALARTMQQSAGAAADDISAAAAVSMDHLQDAASRAMDHMAALLGAPDISELTEKIVAWAGHELAGQLVLAVDDDGQAVIRMRQQPPGQVFVTMDPALAPPDSIVIDAR